jgi:hypothetical protein
MKSNHRQPPEFVTGDLVYFVGYEGSEDATRLGIVKEVVVGKSHFPLYEIYWFREKLESTHTATHIDLVYTEEVIESEINPRSLQHRHGDRVKDRGEGD